MTIRVLESVKSFFKKFSPKANGRNRGHTQTHSEQSSATVSVLDEEPAINEVEILNTSTPEGRRRISRMLVRHITTELDLNIDLNTIGESTMSFPPAASMSEHNSSVSPTSTAQETVVNPPILEVSIEILDTEGNNGYVIRELESSTVADLYREFPYEDSGLIYAFRTNDAEFRFFAMDTPLGVLPRHDGIAIAKKTLISVSLVPPPTCAALASTSPPNVRNPQSHPPIRTKSSEDSFLSLYREANGPSSANDVIIFAFKDNSWLFPNPKSKIIDYCDASRNLDVLFYSSSRPLGAASTATATPLAVSNSSEQPIDLNGHVMYSYSWFNSRRAQVPPKKHSGEFDPRSAYLAYVPRGVVSWMDFDNGIQAGDNLYTQIAKAILAARVVIVFFSKEYSESKNCERELSYANDNNKKIVPVIVGPKSFSNQQLMSSPLYFLITRLTYFDARCDSPDEEPGLIERLYSVLVSVLQSQLNAPSHPNSPTPPAFFPATGANQTTVFAGFATIPDPFEQLQKIIYSGGSHFNHRDRVEVAVRCVAQNQDYGTSRLAAIAWISAEILGNRDNEKYLVHFRIADGSPKLSNRWVSRSSIRVPCSIKPNVVEDFPMYANVEVNMAISPSFNEGYGWWPGVVIGRMNRWVWVAFAIPTIGKRLVDANQLRIVETYETIADATFGRAIDEDNVNLSEILNFYGNSPPRMLRNGLLVVSYDCADFHKGISSDKYHPKLDDVVTELRKFGYRVQPLQRFKAEPEDGRKESVSRNSQKCFTTSLEHMVGTVSKATVLAIVTLVSSISYHPLSPNGILESETCVKIGIPLIPVILPSLRPFERDAWETQNVIDLNESYNHASFKRVIGRVQERLPNPTNEDSDGTADIMKILDPITSEKSSETFKNSRVGESEGNERRFSQRAPVNNNNLYSGKNIVIICNDAQEFTIPIELVRQSVLLQTMLEDFHEEDDEPRIPLPNVSGPVFALVLEYLSHHVWDDPPPPEEDSRPKSSDDIEEWDRQFINVDQESLFEIILAANYLDIKPLLDLGCKTVANMIKGRTVEEIRRTFSIVDDFTPEEEEQIRK
ncbi:hypothetical protein HK098_002553 [Nowakowskiella sp. JEL0407]|nr:hypothetical protein HK098_002553 [Nowakowskiella sp. JEL0407]